MTLALLVNFWLEGTPQAHVDQAGANQNADFEFARSLISERVPIVMSETPFIG